MNAAFYTGVSGLVAYQKDLDVTANNMANVNTTGFQGTKSDFSDLLYTRMNTNVEGEHLQGSGVKQASVELIFKPGTPASTNGDLDFAMVGNGFFAVDRGGSKPEYTRNGEFSISAEDGDRYLTTTDGGYVLNSDGDKIEIPQVEISSKKSKSSKNSDDESTIDYQALTDEIGIYTFSNPYGLQPVGNSSFLPTGNSGKAEEQDSEESNGQKQLLRGFLESSSVDLSQEMVNMIQTQRAFQFSAKIVQTADEIEEVVNNLR